MKGSWVRRAWPLLAWVLWAQAAESAPAASGSASARPAPAASASTAPAASGSAAMPAGHPPVGAPGMPPGHPGADHADTSGRFRMPLTSNAKEDAAVPPGTIEVEVRDGEGNPLGNSEVTLGIVENSVAKGESRQRRTARTDAAGLTRFPGLDGSSSFAYRVSTSRDGASYAATPFNLPTNSGMRVQLFAHPVTTDVDKASIAAQGIVYLELRDEVIQIEQAYRVFNLGTTTWLATDVQSALPEGFKAFNAQRSMSDQAWEGTPQGARFHGTLAPGVHDTAYRFQIPYPQSEEATIELGLMPHVQAFRVISDAPRGLELEVEGFPAATPSTNGQGQKVLLVEKELPRLDPSFRRVRIHLHGLPRKPQGRWYALAAALIVLAGTAYVLTQTRPGAAHTPEEMAQARTRLLDELARLERDHASGEVGPRTYEAARRTLLDSLARLLQTS